MKVVSISLYLSKTVVIKILTEEEYLALLNEKWEKFIIHFIADVLKIWKLYDFQLPLVVNNFILQASI